MEGMLKAYKYRIYPNAKQREFLEKTFGCVWTGSLLLLRI
ncbi:MAG TPA: helix-turn-helix domain-containing protein [Pseudothermotoga sp.]